MVSHAVALLLICAGTTAYGSTGSTTRHPVIGIVAKKDAAVSSAIGEVTKHPQNPLLVQDKPWEPRLDNGYPNVIHDPNEPLGTWRLWYGDCVKGCGSQVVLYANSSDGLSWEKPDLGIYDVGWVRPDLKAHGKKNNIVMKGGGVGVYLDPHEKNASRRFKGFGGVGCFGTDGKDGCVDGMGTSADGLRWEDPVTVHWPSPDRYDCHNNVIWDEKHHTYIATTRDGFRGNPGRAIGMARSTPDKFHWDTSKAPPLVEEGDAANQLYSQITFIWPGMETQLYLGIVMVYEIKGGFVHCRLSWSTDASKWQWVDPGGLTGRDFIPLGQQLPPTKNAFDSHVCFAAAQPITVPGEGTRIYYMGGNGPHSGERNSSLGLATLGPDRYAGLSGTGSVITKELQCSGKTLTVTADVMSGGSVRVSVVGAAGLSSAAAIAITGNSTDQAVKFKGGQDLSSLIGKNVAILIELDKAIVYTVGFTGGPSISLVV